MITVGDLFYYPIKSCAGVKVEKLSLDDFGPTFDRRFMLVDFENGRFITQRDFPVMSKGLV